MRVFDFNSAIVRTPGGSVVDGIRADGGPSPSYAGLLAEHAAYVDALRAAGVGVTVLAPLEDFPDSVFVEDPALVFSEGAILLRPGTASRLGEAATLAEVLAQRFPCVLRLDEGHADGGDILVTPHRVIIGRSARTDADGAERLRRLLSDLGRESSIVATPEGTLHLKSASTLLDEETILTTEALARSGVFDGYRLLVTPPEEAAAANALRVNGVVLAGSRYPRTLDLLARHGFEVAPLSVSEIGKLDAGLTCMSLRWFDPALGKG